MNKINWQERLNQLLATGKNKSYFTVGITVLFVVVMSIIGVVPAVSSLSSQAEDNIKRDEILGKMETKLKALKTLALQQDQNAELVSYFSKIMPDSINQKQVLDLLNSMAVSRNVFLSSFTFDNESRESVDRAKILYGEKVNAQLITLQSSGSKEDIISFLKDIDTSAYIMSVEDFSINRNTTITESGNSETIYIFNLKVLTYYFEP